MKNNNKLDTANQNIKNLISLYISSRKELYTDHLCPYLNNIDYCIKYNYKCIPCKDNYFKKFKENLMKEYLVDNVEVLEDEDNSRYKVKETVDVGKLIETFSDMAKRETLLTGSRVSQDDLLVQIIGTIVKVVMED